MLSQKTDIDFGTVDIIPCRTLKTEYCVVKESKVNCYLTAGFDRQ